MKKQFIYTLALVVGLSSFSSMSFADKKKKNKGAAPAATAEMPKKDAKKSIKETTKSTKLIDGLFAMYQDTTNGSVYMKIKKDQLNKEFIYFNYSENGAVSAGHFKGAFRDNEIFSIKKYYDKIEFIKENTS